MLSQHNPSNGGRFSMRNRSRKAGWSLGAAVTVTAVLGIAIANGAVLPTTGETTAPQPPTLRAAMGVDPAIASNLALFRQPASALQADSPGLGAVEHSRASSHFGLRDELARKAATSLSGHGIYVIPGNGWVCVTGVDVGNSCTPADQLNEARPQLSVAQCGPIPQGQIAISGIAPDGVNGLGVTRAGTQTPITVTNNVFFALFSVGADIGVPDSMTWQDAKGNPGTLSLQLPASTITAHCAPESRG
jgi:hypothetical protein